MQNLRDAENFYLDAIINYLKDIFYENPFAFEICATDFWCLENGEFQFEKIYITPSQGDKGIDAIVVPNLHKHFEKRNFYLVQVTKGSKSSTSLNTFLKIDPRKEYGSIVPQNANCKRVILALGSVPKINDPSVSIIQGRELARLILVTGNKYKLFINGELTDKYLLNILNRAEIWKSIHNTKNNSSIFNDYANIFAANFRNIKSNDLTLPGSFLRIIRNAEERIMDITTSNIRERFLVRFKSEIRNLGLREDGTKEELALFIGNLVGYEQNEYFITPTKRYLSIKLPGTNKALAHFDWSYNSPNAKKSLFGFKATYDQVRGKHKRLKPAEAVNSSINNLNYLHFKMNTFLTEPSLKDGKLIKELLELSKIKIMENFR